MFGLGKKKGPQEVSLNSGEYSFEVEPDQNILDAAGQCVPQGVGGHISPARTIMCL